VALRTAKTPERASTCAGKGMTSAGGAATAGPKLPDRMATLDSQIEGFNDLLPRPQALRQIFPQPLSVGVRELTQQAAPERGDMCRHLILGAKHVVVE